MALFIGLMSGTSLDGVDGVLADWSRDQRPTVLASGYQAFDDSLRAALLQLNQPGSNELHRAALAGNAVARCYADVAAKLLAQAGLAPAAVSAVGAHGQTIRHQPQAFDGTGYTLQLLNGHLLAEQCGIDVVCDLRGRDLAAGGQGAPLVPAVHAALFADAHADVAVLNLGGIGNLTLMPVQGPVLGFDCGPGNVLLDAWCETHTGQRFDAGGRWAATGHVDAALLAALLADPFFALPPPKSTGRDLFHRGWLDAALARRGQALAPADVQATLAMVTAASASDALRRHAPSTKRLLVCGGGAFNEHLMALLAAQLHGVDVQTTATEGVPPQQVEALAFSWLARAFVQRLPGNLPAVTGASGPRVLGVLHPA